jgi:hypothetical protein
MQMIEDWMANVNAAKPVLIVALPQPGEPPLVSGACHPPTSKLSSPTCPACSTADSPGVLQPLHHALL